MSSETPETPDALETPETPDAPETPETPDALETLEVVEEKVMVVCTTCNNSLSVPPTYSGTIRCPVCADEFRVESSIKRENERGDEDYLEIDISKDRRFWIGLVAPLIPTILTFIVVTTGLHQPSSPDIMGVMMFVSSLCMWPILGFVLAKSSGTFVLSFRAGARVSAILSLMIVGVVWFWFFAWISGGVTN